MGPETGELVDAQRGQSWITLRDPASGRLEDNGHYSMAGEHDHEVV
jgi:hypothetical protein